MTSRRASTVLLGLLALHGCAPGKVTPAELAAAPVLAVGGDVQLGRRMNAIATKNGTADALSRLAPLHTAALSYVNLESVVAAGGTFGRDKGEAAPYYYRGRPEMLGVLHDAGIDVVGTANNHVGDYGGAAITEQNGLLDAMGIAHPGSGATRADACAPVFRRAGDLVVAFLTVDATEETYGANYKGNGQAGSCTLSLSETPSWTAHFAAPIADARTQADLVFVGVHWGVNKKTKPTKQMRAAAKAIITAGADGILGSSAHRLHGVGVIDGRPVIYDAGNLLFDSHYTNEELYSALFQLLLSPHGVLQVRATPVRVDYGFTAEDTTASGQSTLDRLVDRSAGLGTTLRIENGDAVLDLPRPARRAAPTSEPPPDPPKAPPPAPATVAPDGCVVTSLPADVTPAPTQIGPYTLLASRVSPASLERRQSLMVETWWTTDHPSASDDWLYLRGEDPDRAREKRWWGDHEPCDWGWPTSRWKAGDIIHDVTVLRPPSRLSQGTVDIVVSGLRGSKLLHPAVQIATIQLDIPTHP